MQGPWGTLWGEAVEARKKEAKILLEYPQAQAEFNILSIVITVHGSTKCGT
jgi:hypothetical protein